MKNKLIVFMFILSFFCAGVFSYFASKNPDGLLKVAKEKGFIEMGKDNQIGIIADYTLPLNNEFFAVAIPGIIGVFLTFAVIYLFFMLFSRNQ